MAFVLDDFLIAAAIAAASAGVTAKANRDQNSQQDADLARGIRERAALQDKGDAKVRENIQDLGKGGAQEQQALAANQYLQALRTSQGRRTGGPVFGGSQRFAQDAGAANTVTNTEGTALAQNLSALNAPLRQRQEEADALNNTASDINDLNRGAASSDFLARLRANSRRPNAGLIFAGQLGSGLASGYASSSGAGEAVPNAGAGESSSVPYYLRKRPSHTSTPPYAGTP